MKSESDCQASVCWIDSGGVGKNGPQWNDVLAERVFHESWTSQTALNKRLRIFVRLNPVMM